MGLRPRRVVGVDRRRLRRPGAQPGTRYRWSVRTWTVRRGTPDGDAGTVSDWSQPAQFGTARSSWEATPIWVVDGDRSASWTDYTVSAKLKIDAIAGGLLALSKAALGGGWLQARRCLDACYHRRRDRPAPAHHPHRGAATMRLRRFLIPILILAAAGGFYLWQSRQVASRNRYPAERQAAVGNVEEAVLASGALEPVRQVSVGAQVSGPTRSRSTVEARRRMVLPGRPDRRDRLRHTAERPALDREADLAQHAGTARLAARQPRAVPRAHSPPTTGRWGRPEC